MTRDSSYGEKRVHGLRGWVVVLALAAVLAVVCGMGLSSGAGMTLNLPNGGDPWAMAILASAAIVPVAGWMVVGLGRVLAERRRLRRIETGACVGCGYPVRDQGSLGVCPECGLGFDASKHDRELARTSRRPNAWISRELPATFGRMARRRGR